MPVIRSMGAEAQEVRALVWAEVAVAVLEVLPLEEGLQYGVEAVEFPPQGRRLVELGTAQPESESVPLRPLPIGV